MITQLSSSTFQHIVDLFKSSRTYYLVLVDRKGDYAYINDYFLEKYAGFYKDKASRPASAALHPDDHDLAYQTSLLCLANPNESHQVTLRKLNGTGGYIITQWDFKVNLLADGNIDGIVGIGYDITDFESRQDHIRFLTSTLRDVAYKQSHLLRRPLANIVGLIDILDASQLDEVSKPVIQMLKQSCAELNQEFDSFLIKDGSQTVGGYRDIE
jgi:signal transduction histidine kinase